MVSREPKLKYGAFQIFDRVKVGQTQGFRSPKWKTSRSPGGTFSFHFNIFGNRRLDLDEEDGKLFLRIS